MLQRVVDLVNCERNLGGVCLDPRLANVVGQGIEYAILLLDE
jgi:hypothetical protein